MTSFPWNALAAITLVVGGTGGGEARTRARCKLGDSPLLSGQHCLINSGVRSQVAGTETLSVRCEPANFFLRMCPSSSQNQHLQSRRGQCWSKRGWCEYGEGQAQRMATVRIWTASDVISVQLPLKWPPLYSEAA